MAQPYAPLLQQMLLEFQQHRLDSAERISRAILRINPRDLTALQVQGLVMAFQGRFLEAVETLSRAIRLDPKNQDLLTNLAKSQYEAALYSDAVKTFEKLNQLSPNKSTILTDLGTSHAKLRQYDQAAILIDRAIRLNPDYFLAWSNKGNLLGDQGYSIEAISCYQKALQLNPNYPETWTSYGNALYDLGRFEEACEAHDKAISLQPNYAEAWHNKANALTELKQNELALNHYSKAYEIKPQIPLLVGQLINSLSMNCSWIKSEPLTDIALKQVEEGKAAIHPFIMLQTKASPALQLQGASTFIRERFSLVGTAKVARRNYVQDKKIRVGYFSSDFKEHPVGILMENLIKLHDRSVFDISGYFLSKKSDDPLENSLMKVFDSSYDLFGINDIDAHKLILQQQLDIAIDLNGHTAGARTGLFAKRIAPIQVNYLGFAGTSGASFYDYLIADEITVPPDQQAFYTEQLAYLPNSFFPADTLISHDELGLPPLRQIYGLPESSFIFACFNNSYKITSEIFSVWMRILQDTPNSVLWLTKSSEAAIMNLRYSAQTLGVDPARILFAERVPTRVEHLSRLRLINLFLDTPHFNAHTTAADALWAGAPVLTKIGSTFASRVAASQLSAIGMNELIVTTDNEYYEKALEIAKNPDLLAKIRSKQEFNRLHTPLFNTPQYVKNLETLYLKMLQ